MCKVGKGWGNAMSKCSLFTLMMNELICKKEKPHQAHITPIQKKMEGIKHFYKKTHLYQSEHVKPGEELQS